MNTLPVKAVLLLAFCCFVLVPRVTADERDRIAEVLEIEDWSYREYAILFRRPE